MNSKNELKYKRKSRLFSIARALLVVDQRYILALFCATTILLFTGLFSSLRILTVFFGIIFILIWIKLKNPIISALLVGVFSLPLFNPNKYYSVVAIKGLKELFEFKGDYLLGFGVNISNIFILLASIFLVRELTLKRRNLKVFTDKKVLMILLSILGFFVFGAVSSMQYSPYPEASYVWLIQYMQGFIISFLLFYIFTNHKQKFNLLYPTMLASIFLESLLGLWQFLKQASVGLPIEFTRVSSFFAQGLDEPNALFRVSGTFLYPNQLALIIHAMIILIAPLTIRTKKPVYFLGIVTGLVMIVLSQSRSIWIATFCCFLFFVSVYKREFAKLLKHVGYKRFVVYASIFVASLSFIIIPRIILSANAPYKGAGIPLRVNMIKESIEALQYNPWIGYGVGTNESTLYSFFPQGVMAVFPSAVHQAYFQLALEVGILGLIFFLFPFIYTLRNLVNLTKRRIGGTERIGFRFIYVAGLVAFFLYYTVQPHVGIVEFSYLGVILGFGLISAFEPQNNGI